MPEEKKDFLKREDIRTMQKDIAVLREGEANREREKIADLEAKARPQIDEQKSVPPDGGDRKEKIPAVPPVLKPTSLVKKIAIRALIAFLGFFILSFVYWFLKIR
ncbi:MAG: hypothetical protein V1705_00920 [bacterium]